MNAYDIYEYMEFIIFSLYLIFIFLSIQIWFSWKHVDKKELKPGIFIDESFFKRIWLYVFFFSISFMLHEFLEGTNLPGAMIYFEFFELLGYIIIVLFAYEWYIVLRRNAHKKSLPQELTETEPGKDTTLKN